MTSTRATSVGGGPRPWLVVGLLVLVLGAALVGGLAASGALRVGATGGAASPPPSAPAGASTGHVYDPAIAAPPLRLTDSTGRPFDLATLRGTAAIVYFGYTHCPDVCPATIGVLNRVLATSGRPVRMVFVTVDPERDTVAALADYLDYLDPAYIALTGSATEIRSAAAAWGVSYARVESTVAAGYAMAHTADTFLVGPDGRLLVRYPFGTEAGAIVADLDRLSR